MTTAEAPQAWYVSRTPFTAWQLSIEHVLAILSVTLTLRRVLCTCAESWRVQPKRVVVCDAGQSGLEDSAQQTLYDETHAEGPTSIRQGALENGDRTRALSLRGCTHRVHDGSYTDRAIAAVCGAVWAATPGERAERARPVLTASGESS